ncbi:hypothetical protein JG688_00018693 [Phytophthora aleatoria]|uniref:Uncharacterized protein n=1 Tax=Phytophthora aleatoria TaxID=2496075 RepID=A0A8J5MAX6_9STRA|nr:hypothetical protein JG688_00018693 [Phytophthora aleatoria]
MYESGSEFRVVELPSVAFSLSSDSDENGNDDEEEEDEVLTQEPMKYYVDYSYGFLGE